MRVRRGVSRAWGLASAVVRKRNVSVVAVGAFALLGACVPGLARADATLGWRAAGGCMDGAAFARAVEATVGEPLVVAARGAQASLRVEIVRRAVPPGFVARVEVGAASAPRTRVVDVDGDDCRGLDDALVVVASLLLDDALRASERSPARPIRAPAARPRRTPLALAVRLGARARVDVLPGLAAGGGLEAEAAFGALAVFVGAWAWPPVEALDDGVGGRFSAWTGELGVCLRGHVSERVTLGGCVGGAAGFVQAMGVGLDPSFGVLEPAAELDARAVADLVIARPLSLWIAVGLVAPLLRPEYRFSESGAPHVIFRPAALAPDVAIGLEIRAP